MSKTIDFLKESIGFGRPEQRPSELAEFIEFLKEINVCYRKALFCLRKTKRSRRELAEFIEFLRDVIDCLLKIIVLLKENMDFPPRTPGIR